MISLDEAIKHCEEKAEYLKEKAKDRPCYINSFGQAMPMTDSEASDCLECAKEHEQLAFWLKELKAYKESGVSKLITDKPLKYHGTHYLAYKWEWLMSGDNLEREIALLRDCKEAHDEAAEEARREAMKLDEADGTLKGRGYA